MQADDSYTWGGEVVHQTFAEPNAPTLRQDRSTGAITVTIGNVDLPAFVSNGQLYVQAPLPHLFEAFAESLSEFVSDMEVRVSIAGGTTLSLDRDGRPVSGARVAKSRMVRGRRKS